MAEFVIEQVERIDSELVEATNRLLRQLTPNSVEFTEQRLSQIVEDSTTHLFVVRQEGRNIRPIVGMLTLGSYLSPTGRKVWVEDVVVEQELRGKGLGRQLIDRAMEFCRREYAPCTLMLTSNPQRIEANELYRSAGFERKETNVYKMNF